MGWICDVTGTGTSTVSDVAKLYQYLKGKVTMDDCYVKAGNVVDSDSTIKVNDVAKLYQFIKGKINIFFFQYRNVENFVFLSQYEDNMCGYELPLAQ